MGEMALQGPHHVAKQSIRTALSVVETRSLNSFVLPDQRIEQPCYGMAGQRKPQHQIEQPERQVA
ncbi:hypothetical protein LB503_003718 [Fusarium chuoi]|nr:hypothetical protein LB503_003718 [Fusarium chuoi]